jgi:hypothetical protein
VHIPKFRYGAGKILANASTPDFSDASDKILGYALSENGRIGINVNLDRGYGHGLITEATIRRMIEPQAEFWE